MPDTTRTRGETPIRPVYPFNAPGAPITLYEGPIAGVTSARRPGRIDLDFGPKAGLRWSVQLEPGDHTDGPEPSLTMRRGGHEWTIEAHRRSTAEGWINVASFHRPAAPLRRVTVHWMNLPDIAGPSVLTETDSTGSRWWLGRWQVEVDGWSLTLDERPDHSQATATAHSTHLYVLTHVMDIRRSDGDDFDIQAVERLLECLRVTFSFAFGRWVAPALPVGYGANGGVAWEKWTSPICDPMKKVSQAWLYPGRPSDLTELTRKAVAAFSDPSRPGFTRLQMCMAIQAVEAGFVEQRILSAAPALEHIAWVNLVLGRRMTPAEYKQRFAEDRLRLLLQEAGVPTDVDHLLLPALARFAQPERMDGPTAVTRVRNRLIHPQTPEDQIYRHEGLVQDTWQLSRHYVTLLILRSIDYRGSLVNLVRQTGWAGDAALVPWADSSVPHPRPPLPPARASARRRRRR